MPNKKETVDINDEFAIRLAKLETIRTHGIHPYPERFAKTHAAADIASAADGVLVATAGRILTIREMGKIVFCHILDQSGRGQIVIKSDEIGKESFKQFLATFDPGDFIGAQGTTFTTNSGQRSVLVKEWTFLGKALRPLPEKWHGLKDTEARYRQRYLDLIANPDTMPRFVLRSAVIRAIREFYWQNGFIEVETPTLLHAATGAAARPYITHNNALDIDVALRISHELPLKELIVGGFDKIFELGKAFRNEGHDPSHLPEHTHLEHYAAYWNFEDNISFTEQMFSYIFKTLQLPSVVTITSKDGDRQEVNFTAPWQRVDYIELVNRDTGLDILSYTTAEALCTDLRQKKISIEGMEQMSLATLIDNVYKKVSRPKIIQPTILYHYPKILQPLARVNDADDRIVDQFQLVVNGWELVKAYSELVDPVDQRQRFEQQKQARAAGDDEAMDVDEDYLTAMEHGMPPISGWGLGIDRLIAILTEQENLRDVVLFPLMKPIDAQTPKSKTKK